MMKEGETSFYNMAVIALRELCLRVCGGVVRCEIPLDARNEASAVSSFSLSVYKVTILALK